MKFHPLMFGTVSAVLFGLSTPLAKLVLEGVSPLQLAGLLYLGGGSCLLIYRAVRGAAGKDVPVPRMDRKRKRALAGSILFGGVLAPLVLLLGLRSTTAASAALLTNFEAAATVMVAGLVFKEHVGRRIAVSVTLFTTGALVLSFDPTERLLVSAGAVMILLSCIFWALDNNISRSLSGDDPSFYVMVKGLTAGSFSFTLSLLIGNGLPPLAYLLSGLLLGALAYGLSLVLFMLSLRQVGAARTGTVFALSPFAGVAFSLLIFRTLPGWQFAAALPLMAVGFALLFWETHAHPHAHEEVVHAHSHAHDDHHRHGHQGPPHSHVHRHEAAAHSHPHVPDLHHRHRH